MTIDVSYDELLVIANALKARGDQLAEVSKKWPWGTTLSGSISGDGRVDD
jgi:hypothetical protein